MKNTVKIITIAAMPFMLNACVGGAVFTGAQAAKTIAEERSAGNRFDDNAIALSINNKFIQKDFEGMFGSISTDIKEGRVLLTGKVKEPLNRMEAERLVWEVNGVREVINEIEVTDKGDIGTYMNDAWISNQLSARMLFTKNFKDVNYNNSVVSGVVYLMGIAQDQKELEAAVEIARRINGVKRVVSHIILKDDPRRGVWAQSEGEENPPQYQEYNSDPVVN